ncbi:hypothetical protein HYH03_016425 [Edaphochlamys debaryana]|uniref:BTB domain-containing protein n=1 Tax=Edaphochlamys debaryana TaxID=47281 RepID=A0A835XJ67_9CHLO|nr:hypothetical protein HYH03_016425 [Edaphochlamys debaryana]|eukprot:KAG2484771.1 hypothetical protein HYH03_016425 [Edaphochlamys debaryana]
MRLDADNVVTLATGHKTEHGTADGEGGAARLNGLSALAADGRGAIYLLDNSNTAVLKVAVTVKDSSSSGGDRGAISVAVSTLPGGAHPRGHWKSLAYQPATGSLFAFSQTTAYVLMQDGSGKAPIACGPSAPGMFNSVLGTVVDDSGTVYVLDNGSLHSLDAWGQPSKAVHSIPGNDSTSHLAYLPGTGTGTGRGGVVARLQSTLPYSFAPSGSSLLLVKLDTLATRQQSFSRACDPGAELGSSCAASQLGSLLRQPSSGQATLMVTAGGEAFVAHRSVLCAGSEYFARMLEGGFAEGSGAGPVDLADADPTIFQTLLGYFYTGRLDVPDALLRPTCELAGRLLLPPELQGWLQGRLLGRATPGTAIDDLVWADRHGMSQLAAQLKERIVRHRALVGALSGTKAALQRLSEHSPGLLAELCQRLLGP